MTQLFQALRAEQVHPRQAIAKPANPKDLNNRASFADILGNEIHKEPSRKSEKPGSEPVKEKLPVKSDETEEKKDAVLDPPQGMALSSPAPQPQPVPPAPDGSGGKSIPAEGQISSTAALANGGANELAAALTGEPAAAVPANGAQTVDEQQPGAEQTKAGQQTPSAAELGLPAETGKVEAGKAETFQADVQAGKAAASQAALTTAQPEPSTALKKSQLEGLDIQQLVQKLAGARQPDQDEKVVSKTPALSTTGERADAVAPSAGVSPGNIQAAAAAITQPHSLEPARLTEAQSKGMVWQVCQNVETLVQSRQTTLRVMLNPEELGRIDLRLTSSSSGMTVSLVAHNATTGQLLESQVSQLRQALDQAGIHLSQLNVGQQGSQAGSESSGRQSGKRAPRQGVAGVAELDPDQRMVQNSLEPSEGYDYLI